jgi:integrase
VTDRGRLYFRTFAETGARESEVLGGTPRRIDVAGATITFREQLGRPRRLPDGGHEGGGLRPLETHVSRRTIEITRSLAAALAVAGGQERVFDLTHHYIQYAWRRALKKAASPTRNPSSTTCATPTCPA